METLQSEQKKKRWVLPVLLLLLLCLAGGGYWWMNQAKEGFFFDKQAQDGVIKARTKEDIQKVLDTVVEEGMFNASMNPNPVFPDGKSEGDLWIENIKANHYYTTVAVTLDKTGEKVFQSEGIKPDQNIEKAKLDKDLKKGEYPATAAFTITDPKTLDEIGVVNLKITITVQN
ncbi:MAG: hypothetical protein RR446_06770 [Lachnospiraceae bacterium]